MKKLYFKFADKKKFFKFLDKLPAKDAAKLLATINHIEEYGILTSIKMKWIKKLTHNLYEIRSQVRRNQRRALYFHVKNNHYVITHGFTKKTQKTSQNEINKGIRIKENYLNHHRRK